MTFEIESKRPYVARPEEISEFHNAVLEGEEVDPDGLRERILAARTLVALREERILAAISALKVPGHGYRMRVAQSTGIVLDPKQYPFELGWIFVYPAARQKGYSFLVAREALRHTEGRGAFATSLTDNGPMHRTLDRLGFTAAGEPYRSRRNGMMLQLFLGPAELV